MRHAFSLLELIFVIVLIGIISGIGFYMAQPDYTRQDAQYTLLKLKGAHYRAIGYDTFDASGCVTLTKDALTNNDETPRHEIKIDPIITPNENNKTITLCFDSLGRPHDGNLTELGTLALDTLIQTELTIMFQNNDKNTTIRVFPQSGYAMINSCN